MRQLLVQVPHGEGAQALAIAKQHRGVNLARSDATDGDGCPVELVTIHLDNADVGPMLDDLEQATQIHAAMIPTGTIVLRPPADRVPQQVRDVTQASPFEILLAALQSIGSWTGFASYAVAGGVVAWLGLFTDSVFLLVGAMLLAPFASPALTTAIATARGDAYLLRRSLLRYVVGLAITAIVAALLSLLFSQDVATLQMAATANISAASVLLPLAAGAAGGLHLVQGERSSLVSGAAAGLLVSAALAPPAALIGMAMVIGEWAMVKSAVFLLVLQLVGINLAGAAVLRLYGVSPSGTRYQRGAAWVAWASAAATVLALAAILVWQFGTGLPNLQRTTLAQHARAVVKEEIGRHPEVQLVETTVQFTRADVPHQHTLLVVNYLQRTPQAGPSDSALRVRLGDAVQDAIRAKYPEVTPVVATTILASPDPTDRRAPQKGVGSP